MNRSKKNNTAFPKQVFFQEGPFLFNCGLLFFSALIFKTAAVDLTCKMWTSNNKIPNY